MAENNEKKTEEKNSSGGMANYMKIILLVAMVIVVLFMIFGRNNNEDACVVVAQSPFGQSQAQVWTDLDSKLQAKGIAGFDLDVPEELSSSYPNTSYRVFSYQISEVTFSDEEGNEVIRIDKAKYCGKDILETDDNVYETINKIDVDGKKVKERGNAGKYSAISWTDGEYSYGITAYKGGISEEKVKEYVSKIQ